MLSQEVSRTNFESLVWLDQGLNPSLLGHWWMLYPLGIYIYICIYIYIWFCVVWCLPSIVRSDKIMGIVWYGLFGKWFQILIVCGTFCNVWVWLEWLTQCNLEKRIYTHKWSITTNDNQNTLFFHVSELKHTFNFSPPL